MKPKTLLVLLLATAVLIGVAIWAVGSSPTATARVTTDGPLYPGLLQKLDSIATLEVESADETLRMRRVDGGWVLADRSDFPVHFERVKQALVGLAELEILEAKTKNPERYDEIGVREPSAEGATSTRLRATGASGDVLASLIVGDARPGQRPTLFVRRDGEEQSYLVQGELQLTGGEKAWIDTTILALDRARTESVTVTHSDGEKVHVSRPTAEDTTFQVADVPPGRELQYASVGNALGNLLASLRLEDFATREEVDFEGADVTTAEFHTFDGLVVRLETLMRGEDEHWLRVSASAEPDAELEVAAEVQELSERLAPWAYRIAAYQANTLTKRLEGYLKEKVETTGPPLPSDGALTEQPPAAPPIEEPFGGIEPLDAPPDAPPEEEPIGEEPVDDGGDDEGDPAGDEESGEEPIDDPADDGARGR